MADEPTDQDRAVAEWILSNHGYGWTLYAQADEIIAAIAAARAAARRDAAPRPLSEMALHELQDLAGRVNAALARRVLGDPMQGVTGTATAIRQPGREES